MKKTAVLILAGMLVAASASGAMADVQGMFDQDNPAFGTCNNDVPPEIKNMEITQADGWITVSVTPWVDPYKSEAEIVSVDVFYSMDGMKTWEMAQATEWVHEPDQTAPWAAELGPFDPGDEVDIRVQAMDSEDNMAVQIPAIVTQFPPADEEMFPAAFDTIDAPEGYPANMDITDLSLGFDDVYVYARLTMNGKITGATGTMPNLLIVGFRYPDVRKNPITWNHELTDSRMLAYLPRLTKVGFFSDLEAILGGQPMGDFKYKQAGDRLYMAVERALINRSDEFTTEDMDREGFKLASGTVMADLGGLNTNEGIPDLNAIVKPTDCTGYSIVYFGAKHVVVE